MDNRLKYRSYRLRIQKVLGMGAFKPKHSVKILFGLMCSVHPACPSKLAAMFAVLFEILRNFAGLHTLAQRRIQMLGNISHTLTLWVCSGYY